MLQTISVPTGHILIVDGEHGKLECLSIGDYGKAKNIKADFLGLGDEINGVPDGELMPLEEKWVITLSSQYGCSMKCGFCDVPKVGPGLNASWNDLTLQVITALTLHREVSKTKRLNVHYARMGEPTFNGNVLAHAVTLKRIIHPFLGESLCHPVVSTMMPKNNKGLGEFLFDWCQLKNEHFDGDAGLQISLNSTDRNQRFEMFGGCAHDLDTIGGMCRGLPSPNGRKYALNFAIMDDTIINAKLLARKFSPKNFMVKITPMHNTKAAHGIGMKITSGHESYAPYKEAEEKLKAVGFDVLVFIPSNEEDESKITCGNAILAKEAD